LSQGDVVTFEAEFSAVVAAKLDAGEIELSFDPECDLPQKLRDHGVMPLPPYIRRAEGSTARDGEDYQTIYATHDGAVAAPTAGLHFTPELFAALSDRGIGIARVTLHVGAGTFLPVKADYLGDHRMHAEWGRIDRDTCDIINQARRDGGRVVAIGTTSLRLLESAADADGTLHPFEDETAIFITPGYRFKIVDLLLTNFHLPRSTLFMLVAAFAGLDRMRAAYEHAKTQRYRFYSYGDATLLHRGDRT
jgi:S-adenosylmethionine:tRNA ribosyltransferase-isomerase